MPIEKQYTKEATVRFLAEIDRLIGFNQDGKLTQYEIGEKVGIRSSNITRMRKGEGQGEYYVTLEAC